MPALEAEYIETGKVYFVYRDFPLVDIHPGAVLASHVAHCAGAQDAFWPMHDRIFAGLTANEWGQGDLADFETFLAYADELDLDRDELRACVEENRSAPQIEADYREALELGVRSTPTFVVNGQLLVGAHPIDTWRSVLDQMLAEQE